MVIIWGGTRGVEKYNEAIPNDYIGFDWLIQETTTLNQLDMTVGLYWKPNMRGFQVRLEKTKQS